MTDTHSSEAIEARIARTYEHPSYEDPFEAVQDYRRVQRKAAQHPNKGSTALSSVVKLPRARIRSWLDGGMPDPARGVFTAHGHGWTAPDSTQQQALAALAGHLLGGGAIASRTFVPSITQARRVEPEALETAVRAVGVRPTRRHTTSDTRATEVLPAEKASILGRTLAAWGLPVGDDEPTSLPAIVTTAARPGQGAFLTAYIRHRSANYRNKATTNLQSDVPPEFHQAVAELIRDLTDEPATTSDCRVTVSASAMRALSLAEE